MAAGPFTLSAQGHDVSVTVNQGPIEPYPVQQGSDVPVYSPRVAYSTNQSPFVNQTYTGLVATVNVTVFGPTGRSLFNRTVTMQQMWRISALGRPNQRYCSQGNMGNDGYCYYVVYPNSQGMCLAIDPVTFRYVGGCAIMDDSAAKTIDTEDPAPSKLSDVAYSYDNGQFSQWPWNNYNITIRSSRDPWYVAAVLTRGYMTWGTVAEKTRTYGIALLSTGAVLTLLFLIMTGVMCYACWGK